MTTKSAPQSFRPVLLASTSPFPMLRGPNVFYSEGPDEGTDDTPEEFREQPGDREADPDVTPEPEAETEETEEEETEEESTEDEAEGETEEETEAPSEETPAGKKDWRDRQIAKLREREKADKEEREELRRRAEAAEALLAATPEERETGLTEAARETIRKEEAAKITEANRYKSINAGLEKMDADGKAAFKGVWDERIAQVRDAMSDELMARPDFLEAVTDLPNAAVVYHELAGDLDKMESILALPAHKMGMELARISDRLAKPPVRKISKAPAPIKPIERGGTERDLEDLINDPNADMGEIDRRMKAEEAKRAKAH